MKATGRNVFPIVLSMAGVAVFTVLYFTAAHLYPGGSDADVTHSGFDWMNNYWCDLIAPNGKNGLPNAGRPVALTAMVVLFVSLAVFWFRLPGFFHEKKRSRLLTGYSGIVSMLVLIFVFTQYHDAVIFAGGSLSSIPFIASLRELYRYRRRGLFLLGCFCLVLIALNFFIYLSGWLLVLLPLLQKIALAFFLVWVLLVDLDCLFTRRRKKRATAVLRP